MLPRGRNFRSKGSRSAIEESHTPPHSPTPQPPETSTIEEYSPANTVPVQSPNSPLLELEDNPIEPTPSRVASEPTNIPATWLHVEELWLNLYVDDETTALTTALDFVRQLQNLSK